MSTHLSSQRTPYVCCVRVDRLQCRGSSANAEGVAVPRPIVLSIHAPLTLQNTLPVAVTWSIIVLRAELEQDASEMPLVDVAEDDEKDDEEDEELHPAARRRGFSFCMGRPRTISRHPLSSIRRESSLKEELEAGKLGPEAIRKQPSFRRRATKLLRMVSRHPSSSDRASKAGKKKDAADQGMLEVRSDVLAPLQSTMVHSVSPSMQWHLVLKVDGYEPSAPILLNRGAAGLDPAMILARAPGDLKRAAANAAAAAAAFDPAMFLAKNDNVIELRPLGGNFNSSRTLRAMRASSNATPISVLNLAAMSRAICGT
jgi:hypothetical protein